MRQIKLAAFERVLKQHLVSYRVRCRCVSVERDWLALMRCCADVSLFTAGVGVDNTTHALTVRCTTGPACPPPDACTNQADRALIYGVLTLVF